MRGFEVLVVLAAAAPLGARVPGTSLRMGATLDQLDSALGARGADADAQGRASRKTTVRFFGMTGNATLTTAGGGLDFVHVELPPLSEHTLDYIGDQMRRLGYHGTCPRGEQRSCDWSGDVAMHLETARDRVVVDVHRSASDPTSPVARDTGPRGETKSDVAPDFAPLAADSIRAGSGAAASAAPLAPPTAAADDTLLALLPGEAAPPGARVAHVLRLPVPPAYPDAARRAGVQGVVRLVVDVDETGMVTAAHVVKSIRELDPSALAAARTAHFEVVTRGGRPAPYRARLSFRFTVP
ncbi:MAG TPA: energy transducer TonB [Candidatus Saccharimonadaceae bacterium]|nr:energy transducer TonB [Candidatus Saccharimonadaceae bacterium]